MGGGCKPKCDYCARVYTDQEMPNHLLWCRARCCAQWRYITMALHHPMSVPINDNGNPPKILGYLADMYLDGEWLMGAALSLDISSAVFEYLSPTLLIHPPQILSARIAISVTMERPFRLLRRSIMAPAIPYWRKDEPMRVGVDPPIEIAHLDDPLPIHSPTPRCSTP